MAASKTKTVEKTELKAETKSRSTTVREQIIEIAQVIDKGFVDWAKLLSEAYHKEFYLEWGFTSFEDYCDKELGIAYRKAMYYVDIWDKVKALNLPKAKIDKIGWSKMKEVASVITEENAKELLESAEKLTTRELIEHVQIIRRTDSGDTTPRPVTTTIKLILGESEAGIILEALAEAKKITENENDGVAFEMICQDWLQEKGAIPERTSLDDHVQYLEKVYGVKLTYKAVGKSSKAETQQKTEEVMEKVEGKASAKKPAAAKPAAQKEAEPSDSEMAASIDDLLNM